ncbi:MAG: DUF4974 domain-containing protein [Bacteroidota bacterium]|nr:DUF4974 domain-containing protein [Bacteroidota bacterium]
MEQEELQELVRKYFKGTATDAENMQLSNWYEGQNISETEWLADISNEENVLKEQMFADIQKQIETNKTHTVRPLWSRIAAAASILIILSFGGYLLLRNSPKQQFTKNTQIDISPGNSQATLTLANGKKIVVNKGLKGILANQGNTSVTVKNALEYHSAGKNTEKAVVYNTLSTSNGEQSPFPLILADGTKVWLNSHSSITFPVAFTGDSRTVQVTGEVYFEVVHNILKPFRVSVKGQTIEDIGTWFNVNAYDDEPEIKTTLLEGKISISSHGVKAVLRPGQQARTGSDGAIKVSDNTDPEEAVAWKNGYFQFSNADLFTVMRQLSRWYNVDVAYEGDIPKRIFSGKIHRNLNASEALQMLQYFKVNYKVTGRKIIISK